MELAISLVAVVVAVATFLFTVLVTYRGEQREKKQATLDALNVLQEQAFDNLNNYTWSEVREIATKWGVIIAEQKKFTKSGQGTTVDFYKMHPEHNEAIAEYRKISGYLARIEHFALGVNTGIYDAKVTERAATKYLISLYGKLGPVLEAKNGFKPGDRAEKSEYHTEFATLAKRLKAIEDKKKASAKQ